MTISTYFLLSAGRVGAALSYQTCLHWRMASGDFLVEPCAWFCRVGAALGGRRFSRLFGVLEVVGVYELLPRLHFALGMPGIAFSSLTGSYGLGDFDALDGTRIGYETPLGFFFGGGGRVRCYPGCAARPWASI